MMAFDKQQLPSATESLKGRSAKVAVPSEHFVNGNALEEPFPAECEVIYLGLGCFWGAERLFWKQTGVWITAVGYAGGHTPNPSYEEVCSGGTGHAEIVKVVYNPDEMTTHALLKLFWESHNPAQGMRQGNDRGTQYRSAIYTTTDAQLELARSSMGQYQAALSEQGVGAITTEVQAASTFYYAEAYHQQYLAKNPGGYCGIGGTGICLPPGLEQ